MLSIIRQIYSGTSKSPSLCYYLHRVRTKWVWSKSIQQSDLGNFTMSSRHSGQLKGATKEKRVSLLPMLNNYSSFSLEAYQVSAQHQRGLSLPCLIVWLGKLFVVPGLLVTLAGFTSSWTSLQSLLRTLASFQALSATWRNTLNLLVGWF